MKKILFLLFGFFATITLTAQDISQHISYSRIYDFVDELANEGFIELNSVVKPYSRQFICDKLVEVKNLEEKLNVRQRSELYFFLEAYSLEQHRLPEFDMPLIENDKSRLDLLPPVYNYSDANFRARIQPLLGMNIYSNKQGQITHRWFGADFQAMLGNHVSIYGSLRDNSFATSKNISPRLTNPSFLTRHPGYQYKEPNDYSDSRGGVKLSWNWGTVGLVKDNVEWGDNYNGANILSGRAPSFPMISLQVKPAKWFELNYIHGWLVSNVVDSARYYVENGTKKWYRNHNKYIAANMLTFTPVARLNVSFGNSIVYAEDNVQPGYLLPLAFYKSIDHTLTKGIATENQNSQLFFNISSRNIPHLHLYSSMFFDEIKLSRFSSSSAEKNPYSLKLGAKMNNFPVDNIWANVEFTRTNIINYKHSIEAISYASNSYNLGHYLGDNAQEIYVAIGYKPFRGLDITAYYLSASHGNEYVYGRRGEAGSIKEIISQPFMKDKIWSNHSFGFRAVYEIVNNAYATLSFENSDIQGFDASSDAILGEKRMSAQSVLDYYTPTFLQGKNATIQLGFSIGF